MASQRRTCTKGRSVVLKITDVSTAVVEANYDGTFIRVYTDEDITGLGEGFLAPGLTGIIRDLEPLLVGEDPRNVDKLWSKMRWAASGAGSMGGIVYNAISGIEAALWDVVGKHYGAPIHALLGRSGTGSWVERRLARRATATALSARFRRLS